MKQERKQEWGICVGDVQRTQQGFPELLYLFENH